MKYTIATLALFGYINAIQVDEMGFLTAGPYDSYDHSQDITLAELGDDENVQMSDSESSDELVQESDSDSMSSEEEATNVQLGGPQEYEEMPASMSGTDSFGGYERAIPTRFNEERDDRLMNSLIKTYAREIKKDGQLTGHMFCNREDAQRVADEVTKDHAKHNSL